MEHVGLVEDTEAGSKKRLLLHRAGGDLVVDVPPRYLLLHPTCLERDQLEDGTVGCPDDAGVGVVREARPVDHHLHEVAPGMPAVRLELQEGCHFVSASGDDLGRAVVELRSEEHTSELQSLMRNSYAVFCLKKK